MSGYARQRWYSLRGGGARATRGAGADAREFERRRPAAPFGDAGARCWGPASEEFPALFQAQLVSAPESVTETAGHFVQLVVPQLSVTAVRR